MPNNYKGQNISNEKLKALQQLQENRKIRITKSDKGNKMVIWSECESQEALRQLNTSTYEPITSEEPKRIVKNVANSIELHFHDPILREIIAVVKQKIIANSKERDHISTLAADTDLLSRDSIRNETMRMRNICSKSSDFECALEELKNQFLRLGCTYRQIAAQFEHANDKHCYTPNIAI
ncbi:hypothetical protein GJ496_002773 [Pomphorhynchus laevis]|nr:hypothetical protein GJ496_002773 [Pomphorhynchus laevis]